ncbi:phage shock envelope stress response protein PspM [Nocardia callitridis]|uniref:Uncharacterized protein n=1 Tax=Nocardia callitridis TaxID=648753 RepID=A0ABP9KGE3_9NOCA
MSGSPFRGFGGSRGTRVDAAAAHASAEPPAGARSNGRRSTTVLRAQAALAPQQGSLPDNLREAGEHALVAVRRWADPRERELRRRRRARRRSVQLGTASGLTTAGVVGLAVVSAPVWAVIVLGGGAVALVTGAALSTRRYLRLRGVPLPQAAFVPRKRPPMWSSARAPIARLVRAEQAMHGLAAQIVRTDRLPRDELADMVETAASGSAALHALAADILAMEQALGAMGRSNSPAAVVLSENLRATLARLDTGVVEYEQVVAAAGRILAVPESAVMRHNFDVIVADLRDAADRLDGWAQALTEVADHSVSRGMPPA